MTREKKFGLVFGALLVTIFLAVGFFVLYDKTQEQKLQREVKSLIQLDITKDRYNTAIRTSGKYALVEKTIKKYLDQYAVHLQAVLGVLNDTTLSKLLSVDNYSQDGPTFSVSRQYLVEKKKLFNEKMNFLIQQCNEQTIRSAIKNKNLDSYYTKLYEDAMFDKEMTNDFLLSKELLETNQAEMNQIFTITTQVFDFLELNQGKWQIENGEIRFQTQELVQQYNAYIVLLPKK